MYYNSIKFCCHTYRMHHQCYGSENFNNTIMPLKVDSFEEFSIRSSIDESVINSTSGCNHNNYKLKNNLQCFLILSTL